MRILMISMITDMIVISMIMITEVIYKTIIKIMTKMSVEKLL